MKIEIGSRKVVVEFCCRLGPKWPATWPKMAGDLLRRGRVSPATRRSSSSLFFLFFFLFLFLSSSSLFFVSLWLFFFWWPFGWTFLFVFFCRFRRFWQNSFFFLCRLDQCLEGIGFFFAFFLNKIVFKDKWSSMTPVTGRRFFFLDSFDFFFFGEISTNFGWFVGRSSRIKKNVKEFSRFFPIDLDRVGCWSLMCVAFRLSFVLFLHSSSPNVFLEAFYSVLLGFT